MAPHCVISNGMVCVMLVGLCVGAFLCSKIELANYSVILILGVTSNNPPQVIPNYSSREEYEKGFAMGVTM